MLLLELLCVSVLFYVTRAADPPKFHTDLSPEDRLHYFGTKLAEEVPHYEFTTPQPVDRRRRREDARADETLEYMVDILGEATHLLLERNKALLTPACVIQHMRSNGTSLVYPCDETEVDCFYTGRTGNHSNSWVSATVCSGLHGVIGTPERTVTIQPIREKDRSRARRDTEIAEPHIVYIRKRATFNDVNVPERISQRNPLPGRIKRDVGKKYIETTVVVDPTAYAFHGDDTERVVKTIMNIAAERFLDPSLGTSLYMTLNKLVILEEDQSGLRIVEDSTITLNSFCAWQAGWNPVQDSDPEHADYVLLITKLDFENNGNKLNTGLARGGICGQRTKCSVNEDTGLGTGLTIAHETGHVLGMNHDSAGNDCEDWKNIMSANAASGTDAWKWSKCSADKLKETLRDSTCLDDAPPASAEKLSTPRSKPGTIYSVTQQCKMYMGKDAEVCEDVQKEGQDKCSTLYCRPMHSVGSIGCSYTATPLMDGTDCGNRKWCIQGICVDMGPGSPDRIDGNWSDWEPNFSQCSRSCGGGVKVKRRFCNNPEPMYGGKTCVGDDLISELCNVQECVTSQYHFQSQQCAATDNAPLQGRKYHWVPTSVSIGDDSCKLSCQAEGTNMFLKRGISKDGTDCLLSESAPYARCVVGRCKAFGCDGHMGSGHVFDKCAVCRGRGNTCINKNGTFHGGKEKVFTSFITIPSGSTGITITQKNVYCYLSLDVDGEQLFTETTPRLSGTYTRKGVTIKYQSRPERIEIIGPISVSVKAQVYRKYGPPYVGVDPDVYYEYHVTSTSQQTESVYMWKTKAGSCSRSCGTDGHVTFVVAVNNPIKGDHCEEFGTQVPLITCENTASGTVDDYNCDIHQKPAENPQPCNRHDCPPRWRPSSWSTCSKTCGGGQQHRTVDCVQENNNVEKVLSDRLCQGQSKPVTSSLCNTEACPGVWKVGSWSECSETCGRGLKTREVKCYSSASPSSVIDQSKCKAEDKPASQEYCMLKPCRTDISGSACTDKVENCFGSYGEGVCTGDYKSWARANCMKSCGVCVDKPSGTDVDCKDEVTNCNSYQTGFCTDSAYSAWAKKNCKRFCGYCDSTVTTAKPPLESDCEDKVECANYGQSVCTGYAGWAKTNCKRFCNLCETNTCQDSDSTCADYGSRVCTEYKEWASTHCQNFCGLCDARRKRDVEERAPPKPDKVSIVTDDLNGVPDYRAPEIHNIEPRLEEFAPIGTLNEVNEIEPRVGEFAPIRTTGELDGIEQRVDDIETARDRLDEVIKTAKELAMVRDVEPTPPRPVCNNVLTDPVGDIDTIGELVPDVECEQIIAMSVDNKVEINFKKLKINCEQGDRLTVIDGVTNEEVVVCSSPTHQQWVSSANIALIRFVAGDEGQGYSATYKAISRNDYIPACSRLVTSSAGEISSAKYPVGPSKYPDDICDLFIVGTPGKSVQIVFHTFLTPGISNQCNRNDSVVIMDMEGGEEDMFCGELRPFIWESRGPRVRLVYNAKAFYSGKYSVVDI